MTASDSQQIVRVLLVDDNEDDAMLVKNEIRRGGLKAAHRHVQSRDELDQALSSGEWDIVLCDFSMPHFSGTEALQHVRAKDPDMPFLFVSGTIGEDTAVEAMRNGAQDYIMKQNLRRLVPAMNRELVEAVSRRQRREAQHRLEYLANYDPLTGLANRNLFIEKLREHVEGSPPDTASLAVVYMDINRFKAINDSLGYEAGNLLLKEFGQRLLELAGDDGIATRVAADEFVLMLPHVQSAESVVASVVDLKGALSAPFSVHGCTLHVDFSIGIAIWPEHGRQANELLRCADIAACHAKADNADSRFYDPAMVAKVEERLALDRLMRLGLDNGEFELHYQPKIDIHSRQMDGAEVLLRWIQPERGSISPVKFIPLAEETGFINVLGSWVLEQACQQLTEWQQQGVPHLSIAVNISPRQMLTPGFRETTLEILDRHNIRPGCLCFEITEGIFIENPEEAISVLQVFQKRGVSIALDDFGTGYSSLGYIKQFPFDQIKIDKQFVDGLPDDKGSEAIISAVVAMANALNFRVVAEGVETEEQLRHIRTLLCHEVQGYYYSRPVSAAELAAMFSTTWD